MTMERVIGGCWKRVSSSLGKHEKTEKRRRLIRRKYEERNQTRRQRKKENCVV